AEARNAAAEKRSAAEVDREHKEFANKTTKDAHGDSVQHNQDGDVTSIKRPDGKTTTVDYDGKHSPKEIHDADGHTWKKDGKDGNKWNVYDSDGNRTESYRDVKVQPDGTIVAKGADPLGHAKELTTMTHPDGSVDRTTLRNDGSVVVNSADGSTAVARPDGSSSFRNPDGSGWDVHSNRTRTEWHADGSRTEFDKQGKVTGEVAADKGWEQTGKPDSDGTIHYKNGHGDKMNVNPTDGSWNRTYADGTYETDNKEYYERRSPPDKYGNERGYLLDKKTGKINVFEIDSKGNSRDIETINPEPLHKPGDH